MAGGIRTCIPGYRLEKGTTPSRWNNDVISSPVRRFAVLLVLVTACTAGGSDPTQPDTSAVSDPTSSTTTTTFQPPPPHVEVVVEASPDGFLTDAEGFSLYAFTLDVDRTSSCEGPCADRWPPFLGEPIAGEGVDQSLLGNAERSNGAIQVTYNGMPLYRFVEDTSPGDRNGHGFNDVWFLVSPDGELVP